MADELPPLQQQPSTAPPSSDKPSQPSPPPSPPGSHPAVATNTETALKTPPAPDLKPSDDLKITQTVSFKEESNIVADLPDYQKKSLQDLKSLIIEAFSKREFSSPKEEKKDEPVKTTPPPPTEESPPEKQSEVSPPKKPAEESLSAKITESQPATELPAEVVTEVETVTVSTVDEDGTKTVEAIEETVVAVATAAGASDPPRSAEEVTLWGIPLVGDERSDVVLLKFLRARDFKVKEAFNMIKNTVKWRREFEIESLLEEEFGKEMEEKVVFMKGVDREGHPVCYNVYGEFQRKELYQAAFADEEKRARFLRWRIQFLEKSIRKLDFRPAGVSTIVQVNDLRNSPGPGKWELRQATKQALHLLQDNYPEFVAKQVFVNVPWWYLAVNTIISPFLTQRTKSKFVFSGPAKSPETLFKYIAPEQVPAQYGGLLVSNDQEFTTSDQASEIVVKAASVQTVEFPVSETGGVVVWEVRVIGWDVSYSAEFVPVEGYTAILEKRRKVEAAEEVVSGSYELAALGKVVITVENQASKKKKLIYRWKIK